MSPAPALQTPALPSLRHLALASSCALLGAGAIFLAAILPAEFGVDPLGTGAALGIVGMSTAPMIDGASAPPPDAAPVQAAAFRFDRAEFVLGPYEFIEYKYDLGQGANLLFSWESSAPLIHDFHGQRGGDAKGAEQSYDKSTKQRAQGSLVAPFDGIHGWYWENPGGARITIKVASAGHFTTGLELRSNRTRKEHPATVLEALATR
jgi:hypothetical protein